MSRVEKYNKSKKIEDKKVESNVTAAEVVKGNKPKKPKKKRKMTKKKIFAIIILVIFLLGALLGFGFVNSKLSKLNRENLDKHELSCVDVDGFTNILLLGVDSRDMKNYKDARTDAIIIASIKNSTGEVYLTSIYRDTMLKMGLTDKFDKITHAYFYGGAKESIQSINQALDLNIEKYVVFSFRSVVDAVDAVGGIDVPLKNSEITEFNRVIGDSNQILGTKSSGVYDIGENIHIDGVQALAFGRMRYGVGDDFKRNDRMRFVAKKLLAKFKTMSFAQANDVIDKLLPQIRTNLSNNDILSLAWNTGKYKIKSSKGFPYNLKGGSYNGGYVNICTDLEADVIELHKTVFGQKNYKPTKTCVSISNRIKELSNTARVYEIPKHLLRQNNVPNEQNVPKTVPEVTKKQPEQKAPVQQPVKPQQPVTPAKPAQPVQPKPQQPVQPPQAQPQNPQAQQNPAVQ